ncbi:Alpha-L-arabinofuranosidase 1 isoform B [Micractinium conductrix]|uniref:non-reducing end alpha-L-arabinofuranosidase n=1 Tax=Micractinium conductrix TaxID=554055 RepID=A0A2P6VFF1_9CHLO|nr:Alpha-L-arabinofuranosidase 1 isoform B [Micractinium conductrix]|eukprot:PSC72825.1 Alpha-L-arabinofuranosidase 1 isoform B [Micractinium conductrix]
MAAHSSTPSLLSLPADVLERVLGLTLLAEGAQPEVLLTCKALWEAGRGALHSCARVARPGGQAPAPEAAYIEPLQQHCGTLQHLELHWPEGGLSHGALAACVAAAHPARLRALKIECTHGVFAEAELPLAGLTALEALSLDIHTNEEEPVAWPALPPSLRRLSINSMCKHADAGLLARLAPLTRLHKLDITCGALEPSGQLPPVHCLVLDYPNSAYVDELALPSVSAADLRVEGGAYELVPNCKLRGSGELLGASSGRLTRLLLSGWGLEEPSAALGCPGLQVMELGQCEYHWLQPATLQQLSGLTRLSLQASFEAATAAADFSCLPQLQELCLAAEGLQELPAGVSGLHRLRVLDLTGNRLTALPPGPHLRRLRSLSLASNRFEQLPPALAEATALEELDLTDCRLLEPYGHALSVLRQNPARWPRKIGHAGDGGLYAELVQDRSFDALAKISNFSGSSDASVDGRGASAWPHRLPISLPALAAQQAGAASRRASCVGTSMQELRRRGAAACGSGNDDIILAWHALPGTDTTLTREQPLNAGNPVAMELRAGGPGAGLLNDGYWGMSVDQGGRFALSLYLRAAPGGGLVPNVTVSLVPADPPAGTASTSTDGSVDASAAAALAAPWPASHLAASRQTGSALRLSWWRAAPTVARAWWFSWMAPEAWWWTACRWPGDNARRGAAQGLLNPWPFRADLLGALQDLHPRFLRFPGGCYVEGDWLSGAFCWKPTLGRNEERPGHHNSMWGYWSTDGLGLFEYMLLAEELGAVPVWVVNNGIAHNDQVQTSDIWPWVQEALDSIEFVTGPPDSRWGAVRVAMGRREPWSLPYLAIGNEGCGLPWDPPNPHYKPYWLQNYLAFYGAIKAAHPGLTLITNCPLGNEGPVEVWEYHVYTNPQDLGGLIFASEYAVVDGGGQGNVIGAVAEAAFMLGMERNSWAGAGGTAGGGGAVLADAYAPLFVNANRPTWHPDMIVFDSSRWFGIPSYHVQRMLSEHLGASHVHTEVANATASTGSSAGAGAGAGTAVGSSSGSNEGDAGDETIEAGASCLTEACDELAIKVVNFSPAPRRVKLRLQGLGGCAPAGAAQLTVLGSAAPLDENSFEEPGKISPQGTTVHGVGGKFKLELSPWSLSVLRVGLSPPAAAA